MSAITIAADLIKQFEGLRLTSYYCPAGYKTIGYGHVIEPHEPIGNRINKGQAENLLEEDIRKAQTVLHKYCSVLLTENQQAALISFIFNCGSGAFQASTLRQKLNRGEYEGAADELTKWVNCNGVKLKGLVKRRNMERAVFLGEINMSIPKDIAPAIMEDNNSCLEPVYSNQLLNVIASSIKGFFRKFKLV